jgi:tetratricopeptide (TPR) repeat protein
MSHFKQNDLDDAIADLQHAVRLSPNSGAIYNHLVDVYWDKNDWDNVISNATQIIRVNPSQSAWACGIRGSAYREKGDPDRALKEFATAIRLRPDWDAPHRDRAWILSKKGDLDGATADLNEAVRLDPKNDGNYFARNDFYRKKGDWDAAIANWTEAIANIPTRADFLTERGNIYQIHKKDFSKAIADYNKAVELGPDAIEYYKQRAEAYQRENLNDKAIVDFTKAIELEPTVYNFFVYRADAYFKNGQYQAAREDLDHAIQLNPEGWSSYSEVAYCLATCPDSSFRNGEEALKMARKGCDLKQQDWNDCATALAVAYAEIGDFDNAIRYQKQVLDKVLNGQRWSVSDEDIKKTKERLTLFEQHRPYREPVKSK